jgi:hypothetical protein
MLSISVTIPVAGSWPSADELTLRNRVTAALTEVGIGKCKGAGGGCGEMDFSYNVSDEQVARTAIDVAMNQHLPGVAYRVRVSK